MAGIFLTCFVANLTQSAPTAALSSEPAESTVSFQSPATESSPNSTHNFPSSLSTSVGETSTNTAALSILPATVGAAATTKSCAWASNGAGQIGNANAAATKPTVRGRSQLAAQSSALVSTIGQDYSDDAATLQPISVPATLPSAVTEPTSPPPPNLNSSLNESAGETSPSTRALLIPAAIGNLAPSGTLSAWAGQGVGPTATAKGEAPGSTTPERGQGADQRSGLVATARQTPSDDAAIPPPVSAQVWVPGLQPASLPNPAVEQQYAGTQTTSKQAQTSGPGSAQESGSGQDTQASPGFWDSRPPARPVDPTQTPAAPPSPSSQAVSYPPLSSIQTQQAAAESGPAASNSSTLLSAADLNALAEFSSAMEKFAGADVQTASYSNPSAGQAGQATPASDSEAGNSSTPLFATNHPEVAEYSSWVGNSADADVKAATNPTSTAGQVGQAVPAFGSEASDSSIALFATDHPKLAEFSSLSGKAAGAEITFKIPGSESSPTPAAEKSTRGSNPVTAATPGSGLRMTAGDSVQNPFASKAENQANTPAKVTLRSAQVSGSVAAEGAWQKGNEQEAASAQAPLSSLASPVPVQQAGASAQPAAPAAMSEDAAALQATSIQSSGATNANSDGTGAHANLTESSASGQGKSGQQNGTASGDDPDLVAPIAPGIANNPAPDSTANLLVPHAPSDPASHATAAPPSTLPPPSQPPTTLSAWQNYNAGAGSIVRSASLSGSANGAEMHVELRTGALGPLDVHATLREGLVGAEIHVQGQEAHTLLAAGLPSLERALGERNLRVENITVYQDRGGEGTGGGGKQGAQSGYSPSPQRQVSPWDSPPQVRSAASGSWEDEELVNPAPGLSVRA